MTFGNNPHGRVYLALRSFFISKEEQRIEERPTSRFSILAEHTQQLVNPLYKRKLGSYIQYINSAIRQGDKGAAVEGINAVLGLYEIGAIQRSPTDERGLNPLTTEGDWRRLGEQLGQWRPTLKATDPRELLQTLG